jgi:BASS family bile acid:Na+ symporter
MEASIVTNVLLPAALGVIMLGLGLSLTVADFARVARYPRAVIVGLVVQSVVLVGAAFGLAKLFGLSPELSVGLMLLAASPGGVTANIYSHLAKGDVALNITLTAINSALSLATLPIVVNFALEHFLGQGRYVPPPTMKIVEVAALIILPVAIGMVVRARAPGFAARMAAPVRLLSVVVLAGLVAAAAAAEWKNIATFFASVGLACLAFNLVSMAAGYVLPRAVALPERQAVAIAMEIGIHNGALAIFIALNVLKSSPMSIPAAVYSVIMFLTAAAFAFAVSRRAGAAGELSGDDGRNRR